MSEPEKVPPPEYDQKVPPPEYSQQVPPVQQQQGTTVIVQQPVAIQFGEAPVTLPDGKVTLVHYKSGLLTYLVAGAICIVTGCWCVSLCVLCVDALKDVEHVHPETGQVVGVYKRVEI